MDRVHPGPPFLLKVVGSEEGKGEVMHSWEKAEARPLAVSELGEHYRRYRLADPVAEQTMARSLHQYGQLSPVTACWRDGRAELVDGFKRRTAAAQVCWPTLSVRLLDIDERSAKAAIFGLNSVGRRPNELEEAWIVQALVREDGLSQLGSRGAVGPAQELGMPPAGVVGAVVW